MRTTLTLEPDLSPADRDPFVVRPHAMGLRNGLDRIGFSKLADDLEAAAFLDITRKLKKRRFCPTPRSRSSRTAS